MPFVYDLYLSFLKVFNVFKKIKEKQNQNIEVSYKTKNSTKKEDEEIIS